MDRIIEDGEKLGPKDHAERVALFRVQVIGPLLARDFQDHGELAEEIRAIAAKWHRPPESALGRRYSAPTVERWYYEYKRGGLDALRPRRRSDTGHARDLTEQQRDLLLEIRREHRRATAASAPAHSRRARSSIVAFNRRHFWRTSCSAFTDERRSRQLDPVHPHSTATGQQIDRLLHSQALSDEAQRSKVNTRFCQSPPAR
jgi:transposase